MIETRVHVLTSNGDIEDRATIQPDGTVSLSRWVREATVTRDQVGARVIQDGWKEHHHFTLGAESSWALVRLLTGNSGGPCRSP